MPYAMPGPSGEVLHLPEGERLHLAERVVVAQARGRFQPLPIDIVGSLVAKGEAIGTIEQLRASGPVVSPFSGHLMGVLVHPGELVREGEPIAWLRVVESERVPATRPEGPTTR